MCKPKIKQTNFKRNKMKNLQLLTMYKMKQKLYIEQFVIYTKLSGTNAKHEKSISRLWLF